MDLNSDSNAHSPLRSPTRRPADRRASHGPTHSRLGRYLAASGLAIGLALLPHGPLTPAPLAAQLRPYDPMDWEIFDEGRRFHVAAGSNLFLGQRASLAGTEGDLWEIGTFHAGLRSGRIAVDASGTLLRVLDEESAFSEPHSTTHSHPLSRRRDAGDYRAATTVLLTPPDRPLALAIRFGTRLPTTDNGVGLERDQTDFFGLAAARYDWQGYRMTVEGGVGIHGTRDPGYEQSDVLVFSLGAARRDGFLRPAVFFVGHADGLPNRTIRGNEEMAELRVRLRVGSSRWMDVQWIHGFTDFSPTAGVMVAFGWIR